MTLNLHLQIIYLLRKAKEAQATFGTLNAIGAGAAAQIAAEKKAAEDAAKAAQDAEDKKNQENNIKTNQQNVRKDDRQEEELAKINGKDMSKMTREDVLSLSKDDIAKLSPSQKVALRAILMSKYLTASLDGGITPPDDVSAKMYDLDLTLNERIDLAKSQAAAKYMDYANEQRMLGETPMSLEEYQSKDPRVAGWINAKSVRESHPIADAVSNVIPVAEVQNGIKQTALEISDIKEGGIHTALGVVSKGLVFLGGGITAYQEGVFNKNQELSQRGAAVFRTGAQVVVGVGVGVAATALGAGALLAVGAGLTANYLYEHFAKKGVDGLINSIFGVKP